MTFPPPGPPSQPPQPGQWQPASQPPMPPMPPAAPAPGWHPAAPFDPTPAPGRGRVLPTVVVASLVVIGGVLALSATRDVAAGSDAADQARDAVVRLTSAMSEGDCEGVQAASTGGYFRAMNLTCADIADNGAAMAEVGMSFVIGEADLERDTADVPVEIIVTSDPSQGGTGVFTVVKTGDTWRVSNDQMD